MAGRRTPYSITPTEPSSAPIRGRWWWAPDLAFAGLRIAIGLLFAWHGVQEMFGVLLLPGQGWAGTLAFGSEGWTDAAVKIAGGALLTIGAVSRTAALILTVLAALTHLTAARGPWLANGGELVTLYCLALLMFAVTGPGMFSLEALVANRRARRRRGNTVSLSPWIRKQYRRRELTR